MHFSNPNLAWQERIERPSHIADLPPLATSKTDRLAERVDPGIGPTGGDRSGLATHQALEYGLEFGLDRAIAGLPLPPREATPVIMDHR
jgi:hypothetical protein